MAEFCFACFKEIDGDQTLTEDDVVMDIDLCEGCDEWKPCVIRVKTPFEKSSSALFQLLKKIFHR